MIMAEDVFGGGDLTCTMLEWEKQDYLFPRVRFQL
jgi:hypothetical protein